MFTKGCDRVHGLTRPEFWPSNPFGTTVGRVATRRQSLHVSKGFGRTQFQIGQSGHGAEKQAAKQRYEDSKREDAKINADGSKLRKLRGMNSAYFSHLQAHLSPNCAGSCPFVLYTCLFFTHLDEGEYRLHCDSEPIKRPMAILQRRVLIGRSRRDPGGFRRGSLGRISTELSVLENGSSSIP